MSFSKKYREEIKDFILETIYKNGNVFKEVLEKYPISRQTVSKYIKEFIDKDIVEKAYLALEEEREENVEDVKLEKLIEKKGKKVNVNNERDEKKIKEEQKLIQYLARQGFSLDKIFKKLKEYKENYK